MRSVLAIAVAAAVAGPATAQDTRQLSAAEMRGLAQALYDEGQIADAAVVSDALLQRDPDDVTALIVRARTLIATDDPAAAFSLASRAYGATDDGVAKFVAARLAARAQAEQFYDLRAQFWLRRARQFAPNAEASEEVARDYRFLRQRNPVSVALSFGITPTSNINNGSVSETLTLFGLPFEFELDREGQPIAGLEISVGGTFTYRVRQDAQSQTSVVAQANARTYVIAPDDLDELEAERDERLAACETRTDPESCRANVDPLTKGSDFSDGSVRFGIIHRQIFAQGMRPTILRYSIGRSFYGGDPYTDFADASVSQTFVVSDRNRLQLNLAGQNRLGLDGQADVISYSLGANWSHILGNGDLIRFDLGTRESISDAPDSDYTAYSVGVTYDLAEAWNGIRFGFGLDYEEREHVATIYQPGERRDETITGRVSMQFTNVEYYGFQPVVNLEATQSTSNVDLFDRDYLQLGFDLRSSF